MSCACRVHSASFCTLHPVLVCFVNHRMLRCLYTHPCLRTHMCLCVRVCMQGLVQAERPGIPWHGGGDRYHRHPVVPGYQADDPPRCHVEDADVPGGSAKIAEAPLKMLSTTFEQEGEDQADEALVTTLLGTLPWRGSISRTLLSIDLHCCYITHSTRAPL